MLDVLECFEGENHTLKIGDLLEKQTNIYDVITDLVMLNRESRVFVLTRQAFK